jgi:hypothetical protein
MHAYAACTRRAVDGEEDHFCLKKGLCGSQDQRRSESKCLLGKTRVDATTEQINRASRYYQATISRGQGHHDATSRTKAPRGQLG